MPTRRQAIALATTALALLALPVRQAGAAAGDLIARFTGGTAPEDAASGLHIDAPGIADNGLSVQIGLTAPHADAVLVVAPANPLPEVCTVRFGPAAGSRHVITRIRMGETQNLVAVAQLGDGSFQRATAHVQVVVGGCAG